MKSKYYRYYWYNSRRCERTIGIINADSEDEARDILKAILHWVDITEIKIEEVKFKNGFIEIYYGG